MLLVWSSSSCSTISPVQFIPSFTPEVSFMPAIISVSFNSAPSLHLLPVFLLTPDLEIRFFFQQKEKSVIGMQIETSRQVTARRHLGSGQMFLVAGKISNCRFNTFVTGLYSTSLQKVHDCKLAVSNKIACCQHMLSSIKPFRVFISEVNVKAQIV